MAESDGIIVYAGVYENVDDAREDFLVIKAAHAEKWIGTYDAALFEKDEAGKVKILDTDATVRAKGAGIGLLTGAVIGIIFPPSIIAMGALGAGFGGLIGNMMKGFSRSDIKDLGEELDNGTAGVILVADATFDAGAERLMKRAKKLAKKQVDANAEELKQAIDEA